MLCIVEFAERASYYGVQVSPAYDASFTTSGHAADTRELQTVFSNFMQYPLPDGGNGAGAPARGTQDTAGALGKGEQFSIAMGLLFLCANLPDLA